MLSIWRRLWYDRGLVIAFSIIGQLEREWRDILRCRATPIRSSSILLAMGRAGWEAGTVPYVCGVWLAWRFDKWGSVLYTA